MVIFKCIICKRKIDQNKSSLNDLHFIFQLNKVQSFSINKCHMFMVDHIPIKIYNLRLTHYSLKGEYQIYSIHVIFTSSKINKYLFHHRQKKPNNKSNTNAPPIKSKNQKINHNFALSSLFCSTHN